MLNLFGFVYLVLILDGIYPCFGPTQVSAAKILIDVEENGRKEQAGGDIIEDTEHNCPTQLTLNGFVHGSRQTCPASNSDVDVFLGVSLFDLLFLSL